MKLTDVDVRKAKPEPGKKALLKDEGGLYLEITPSGMKSWRLRIRSKVNGDTIRTLGHYPDMSLAQARKAREAMKVTASAPSPTVERAAPTFREIAAQWHTKKAPQWVPHYAETVLLTLKRDAFPYIGDQAVDEIEPTQIKELLERVEARGAMDVAHDVRQRVDRVFAFAKASGHCKYNPAEDMREVLKAAPPVKARPAMTTLEGARGVLTAVEALDAKPIMLLAFRLLALTAQRSSEVTGALWEEFDGLDGDEPLWKIPAARMKMTRDHWVPLSRQALEVLAEVRKISGKGALLFPGRKPTAPIEIGGFRYLVLKAGYAGKHVPHGWRSSFSTIMNERRRGDRAVIDLMLSHEKESKVEGAYNRAEHLETRREIAQEWSNLLLEEALPTTSLVRFPRRA
jgi:integrase